MTHPGNQKGTTVNQHNPIQPPSVEEYLAQTDPDEVDEPEAYVGPNQWITHNPQGSVTFQGVELVPSPDAMWQLPPDPMERIARALERLESAIAGGPQRVGAAVKQETEISEGVMVPGSVYSEQIDRVQLLTEELADVEAKHETVLQVIADVEAALGKSKAAPALAAKAVIEAWKNPQVEAPPAENQAEVDAAVAAGVIVQPDLPSLADMDEVNESVPGHTRTPHPDGPDFCRECSGEAQEWIQWPCRPVTDGLGSTMGANAVFVPESAAGPQPEVPVAQPAHNAPVEEWREYARSQGFAGPDIDKANRSQIRTALGIAQPVTQES